MKADSRPARIQATVEVRRTHTPDSRAESAFSAVARMARPQGDHWTNAARAMATSGATTSVSTWPGVKRIGAEWKETSIGTGNGSKRFFGRMNGRAVKTNRTWLRPMVATITRTRGRLNRRRSRSSLRAPTAAARNSESTRANQ